MKLQTLRVVACGAAMASAMLAQNNQNNQRQATMMPGGGPDRGKCTGEVVVDDVVQVEIRGNNAVIRTLSGQPGQWRRFQCTGPLPPNPANFHFAGMDGRGRQDLIKDPRNGGPAIIQIEDKSSGSEGYTFDITWGGPPPTAIVPERPYQAPPPPPGNGDGEFRDGAHYRPNWRESDYFRRYGHPFSADEAVRLCQQSVVSEANRRFRGAEIHFDRTRVDDGPGRQDWVVGAVDVHFGPRGENYGFACSVNFDSGTIRSAELDARPRDGRGWGR